MHKNKVGRALLFVVFHLVILPIILIGRLLYYLSKLIRSVAYLLMGNFGSAKEEVSDWSVYTSIKDALR